MQNSEFSWRFDVGYNNITSNQAPGLNEAEKSVFLTQAEYEVVKNYFTSNSKGNNLGQGYDDSAKRQADFSTLMTTGTCSEAVKLAKMLECVKEVTGDSQPEESLVSLDSIRLADGEGNSVSWDTIPDNVELQVRATGADAELSLMGDGIDYHIEGYPYEEGTLKKKDVEVEFDKIDPRSKVFAFPTDVFIMINEALVTTSSKILQVVPLRYDEYFRLMSKPFKRPLKNQAWRLLNSGEVNNVGKNSPSTKRVEIIANLEDEKVIDTYRVRYVRKPKPIILENLDGLTIEGYGTSMECEIDPILHEDILQRAIELAKIAWTATGQENAQLVMTAGQRSE